MINLFHIHYNTYHINISRIGFSFKIYVALWQIASKIIVRNNNIVTFAMTTFDIMCFSKFYYYYCVYIIIIIIVNTY